MTLAQRLRQLRRQHALTQEEFAAALGLTRAAYGAYEQGIRVPDYSVLAGIARFYRISADYLLGLSDTPAAPPLLDGRARQLVEAYYAADPRGQELIYGLALRESLRFSGEELPPLTPFLREPSTSDTR